MVVHLVHFRRSHVGAKKEDSATALPARRANAPAVGETAQVLCVLIVLKVRLCLAMAHLTGVNRAKILNMV